MTNLHPLPRSTHHHSMMTLTAASHLCLVEFAMAIIDFSKSNLFSPPQLLQPCSNPHPPHTTAFCFYYCSCEVYSQYSRHDKLVMTFLCLKPLHWFPMSLSEKAKSSQVPHRPYIICSMLAPTPSTFLLSHFSPTS